MSIPASRCSADWMLSARIRGCFPSESLAGFAGIYFWYFLGQLTRASLLPVNDPRMHEALDRGHGHGEEAFDHA